MQSNRKPLQECKTEAERREHWPQLCRFADMVEGISSDPIISLKAIAWIIAQRKREAAAISRINRT